MAYTVGNTDGVMQVARGFLTVGLGLQLIGVGDVVLSNDGAGSVDTVVVTNTIAGVDVVENLMSASVDWLTDLAVTAGLVRDNINANWANHNFFAEIDGVTAEQINIYQRRAGDINGTIASTATTVVTTDTNMASDTDTIVGFAAGTDSILAANYYEMKIDLANIAASAPDSSDAAVVNSSPQVTGTPEPSIKIVAIIPLPVEAFDIFSGRVTVAAGSNAAGKTWAALSERSIPWLNASTPYIIKAAVDGVWDYELHYL